jgi:hypothetical protein
MKAEDIKAVTGKRLVKTEGLMCTAVTGIFRACKPVRLLHLLVVTSCVYKWSINRVTNPNPIYSHSYIWQLLVWGQSVTTKCLCFLAKRSCRFISFINLFILYTVLLADIVKGHMLCEFRSWEHLPVRLTTHLNVWHLANIFHKLSWKGELMNVNIVQCWWLFCTATCRVSGYPRQVIEVDAA